ncbi:MAG: methyltransferase domain-containing protein [Pseudomonadota bacterium]
MLNPAESIEEVSLPDALLEAETRLCRSVAANVFGYHAAQISSLAHAPDFLATSQTISTHHLVSGPAGDLSGCFQARLFALPLQDQSISLLALHHIHEQFSSRRALWAETYRVLRPGGVVVIVGLNQGLLRRRPAHPRLIHPLAPPAMAEQLRGFDFRTLLVRPISVRRSRVATWMGRVSRRWSGTWLGHFGVSFILVARKRSGEAPINLRPSPLGRLKASTARLGNVQGRNQV